MATIINNPPGNSQSAPAPPNDSGVGAMLLGIVIVGILFFLFLMYGLPSMQNDRDTSATPRSNETMERGNDTTINVPDKIEVDIERKK